MKFLSLLFSIFLTTNAVFAKDIQAGDTVKVSGDFFYIKTSWETEFNATVYRIFFGRPNVDGQITVNGKRVTQGNVYACVAPDAEACTLSGYDYNPELETLSSGTLTVQTKVTMVWVKAYETYLYGTAIGSTVHPPPPEPTTTTVPPPEPTCLDKGSACDDFSLPCCDGYKCNRRGKCRRARLR